MNKEFKKMIKELNDGKNLEERLPQYSNEVSTVLNEYASLQLTLEYYGLKEYIQEEISDTKDTYEEIKPTLAILNELLVACFVNGEAVGKREGLVKGIDRLRNQVIEKMDVITAYVDEFRAYEYVLNRMELSFADGYEEINEEEFLERLRYYLFATQDPVVINSRIQEMVGQLPVRMLKAKFLDYVKKSLERYKDTDRQSLNTFEYMIRTNAMLYVPKGVDTHFADLKAVAGRLKNADYKNLDKTTYQKLCTLLMDSSVYINQVSDIYVSIQKVINSLYIYVLTLPYAMNCNQKLQHTCKEIVTIVNKKFEKKLSQEETDTLFDLLNTIVGRQELCYEKYMALEGSLLEARNHHGTLIEALSLRAVFECLEVCSKLCNNSVFIDIHKEEMQEQVTEELLGQKIESVLTEMDELMKQQPQCLNRAVMANVLSILPVFFSNSNEVLEYAKSSLEQCKNIEEKTVAMRLLLNEMAE